MCWPLMGHNRSYQALEDIERSQGLYELHRDLGCPEFLEEYIYQLREWRLERTKQKLSTI